MAIAPGHPISFTEIEALVEANYPEYTYPANWTVIEGPNPQTYAEMPFITNLSTAENSTSRATTGLPDFLAALAMISPPNLSLRPMSIVAGGDTFDLNFEGTIGIGAGMIFLAPNVWQIFQGSVAGDPATAIVNADILFLEYLAANPNTILVGGLQSVYLFPNPPPPPTNSPQYIAVFRFAFRAR